MPDIFDTLAAPASNRDAPPQGDIFDRVAAAPAGDDIFDQVANPSAAFAPGETSSWREAARRWVQGVDMPAAKPPATAAAAPRDPSIPELMAKDIVVDAPKELIKGIPAAGEITLGQGNVLAQVPIDILETERATAMQAIRRMIWDPDHPVSRVLQAVGLVKPPTGPQVAEVRAYKPSPLESASDALGKNYQWWMKQANMGWEAGDVGLDAASGSTMGAAGAVRGFARSALPMGAAVGASLAGAPGAGAAMLAALEATQPYVRAKEKGLNPIQAAAVAAVSGIGTYYLEKIGLESITARNPAIQRALRKLGDSYVVGAAVNFGVEGGTEAMQQLYQNAVAMGYDEDQKVFDGVLQSLVAAGIGGGVFSAAAKAVSGPSRPGAAAEPPATRGPEAASTFAANLPVQELPVKGLTLSKEVPNFKADANETTGVVRGEELQGTYERLGTAPIVVWERNNGDREIITGRHRFDLAKRTGEETIPGQVVREADGFTRAMAQQFDAEANIRDGNGKVRDYANYFRTAGIDSSEAERRGLLSRTKGRAGWTLGTEASDDLYALYTAGRYTRGDGTEVEGRLSEEKTLAIAEGAPRNAPLQAVGIKYALDEAQNPSADELRGFLQALQTHPEATEKQLDLLGFDWGPVQESIKMGKAAARIVQTIGKERAVLKSGVKVSDPAFKRIVNRYGIAQGDADAIRTKVQDLDQQLEDWKRWRNDPAKVAQVRSQAGLPVAKTEVRTEGKESLAETQRSQSAERTEEEKAAVAPDMFDLGDGWKLKPAAAAAEQFELVNPQGEARPLTPEQAAELRPAAPVAAPAAAPIDARFEGLKGEVDQAAAKLPGVTVNVVNSEADLPEEQRGALRKKMADNGGAEAFYDRTTGQVTVILGNVAPGTDVNRLVLHEAAVHGGLHRLLGDRLDDAMDAVYAGAPSRRETIRQKIGKRYNLLDDQGQWKSPEAQREATEEWLAQVWSERKANPTYWTRFVAWFRGAARSMGFDVAFSDGEVETMVKRAHDAALERRGPPAGKGVRMAVASASGQWPDAPRKKLLFDNGKMRVYDSERYGKRIFETTLKWSGVEWASKWHTVQYSNTEDEALHVTASPSDYGAASFIDHIKSQPWYSQPRRFDLSNPVDRTAVSAAVDEPAAPSGAPAADELPLAADRSDIRLSATPSKVDRMKAIFEEQGQKMHAAAERVARTPGMQAHKIEERSGSFYTPDATSAWVEHAKDTFSDADLQQHMASAGRVDPALGDVDHGAAAGAILVTRTNDRYWTARRAAEALDKQAAATTGAAKATLTTQADAARATAEAESQALGTLLDGMNTIGMNAGRIIQQFRYLKASIPANQVRFIEAALAKQKLAITPQQAKTLESVIGRDQAAAQRLLEADAAYRANPDAATAAARDAAVREHQAAARAYADSMRVLPKKGMFVTMMQMGVLTPMSVAANTVGNLLFMPITGSVNTVAALGDLAVARLTGSGRRILAPLGDVRGIGRGLRKAAPAVAEAVWRGDSTLRPAGEQTQGAFRPVRALVELFTGQNIPRSLTSSGVTVTSVKAVGQRIVEGSLGWWTATMQRALLATDLPFWSMGREAALHEIGRRRGLKGNALAAFIENPDAAGSKEAETSALATVFQGDSVLSKTAVGLATAGPKPINTLLIRPAILFAKTPSAIVNEALQLFVPYASIPYGVAKAVQGHRTHDTALYRSGMQTAAKGVLGATMLAGAYALGSLGLLYGRPDDEKKRSLMNATTGTSRLNWSGFKRVVDATRRGPVDPAALRTAAQWQEGDKTIGFPYMGFPGFAMAIVANGKEGYLHDLATKNPFDKPTANFAQSLVMSTLKTSMDLPMLKGLDNLYGFIYRGEADRFWPQYAATVGSALIPRFGKTVSDMQASWMMDLQSGSTGTEIRNQLWRSRVWTLAKELPLRRDYFGRPIPITPEGMNPWVTNLIDIRKPGVVRADPVDKYLADMYDRTGDLRFIPSIPDRQRWFSWPPDAPAQVKRQVVLSDHQYEVLLRYVGSLRHHAVKTALGNANFQKAPAELQVRFLEGSYERAHTLGRMLLVEDMNNGKSPAGLPFRAIISRYK